MGTYRRSLLLVSALAFALTVEPATAAFPGKNGRIVYATDAGNIRSAKADGTGVRNLTTGPAEDYDPAFSRSAGLIAFARNTNIWVMRANGSHQRKLTNHPDYDSAPSFSANGKRIAFETDRDGDRELFVMKADGSDEHRLTQNDDTDEAGEYSADGELIVFQSDRDGDNEIYTMAPSGGDVTQLTFSAADDRSPSFAPNSNRIVFCRNGASGGIRTMRLDTSGVNQLTDTPTAPMSLLESDTVYSPNGKRVAYRKIGSGEVVTIRSSDGGGEQLVAGSAQSPNWGRRR